MGYRSSIEATEIGRFALSVIEGLRKAKFEAVFAGGCVRDLLLGQTPKDYDIATNALPDDIRKIFSRTVPVGEAFNVILVLSAEETHPHQIEVATFRKDLGIADGRHPQAVATATAEEDVKRRDFTINGMLLDPIKDEILDWVGGKEDLEQGIIRSIGEAGLRIDEDHLRMLRAIRFASRFDFVVETELWNTIESKKKLISKISAERVFDEITKMLVGPHADRSFELLLASGLLEIVLPEALAMQGCEQPPEYHPEGDVWVHTLLLLKQCQGLSPEIAWGCLLHDIGKPPTFSHEPPDRIRFNNHQNVGAEMAEKILKRLKASNRFIDIVCELTRDHLKFKDAPMMKPSTLKRFLRNPNFPLHLEMHRIDCLASHGNLQLYHFCVDALAKLPPEILRPAPLLSGEDLISMGFKPGPNFKKILTALETEQLEGRLSDKKSAQEFIEKNFKS